MHGKSSVIRPGIARTWVQTPATVCKFCKCGFLSILTPLVLSMTWSLFVDPLHWSTPNHSWWTNKYLNRQLYSSCQEVKKPARKEYFNFFSKEQTTEMIQGRIAVLENSLLTLNTQLDSTRKQFNGLIEQRTQLRSMLDHAQGETMNKTIAINKISREYQLMKLRSVLIGLLSISRANKGATVA